MVIFLSTTPGDFWIIAVEKMDNYFLEHSNAPTMNKSTRQLILTLLFALNSILMFGQSGASWPTWTDFQTMSFTHLNVSSHIVRGDGEVVALISEYGSGPTTYRLSHFDRFGDQTWSNLGLSGQTNALYKHGGSGYIVRSQGYAAFSPVILTGYDLAGDSTWVDSLPVGSRKWGGISVDEMAQIAVAGVDTSTMSFCIRLMDSTRMLLLDTVYSQIANYGGGKITGLEDGNFGIHCLVNADTFMVGKVDLAGTILWTEKFPILLSGGIQFMETSDAGLALFTKGNPYEIFKVDSAGSFLWRNTDTAAVASMGAAASNEGGVVVVKNHHPFNPYISLTKYDSLGNLEWIRVPFQGGAYNSVSNITARGDGGWVLSGNMGAPNNYENTAIISANKHGLTSNSLAEGVVYFDGNADCQRDPGEPGLPNILVRANPGNQLAITDASGRYQFNLDSGTYWLSIASQNLPFDVICPVSDSIQFSFPGLNSSVDSLDFSMESTVSCPYLTVELSTPVVRWCDSMWLYTVEYCNLGAMSADSPYVVVELDPGLSYLSSTAPATALGGNAYLFELDTLDVGECGSFQIEYFVSCSLTIGETVCSGAYIYPDTFCTPVDSSWSGASLEVTGECLPGDTVRFQVENVGAGNMVTPSGILIAEDDLLKTNFSVLLNPGQDTVVDIVGNGSTWALFADQVPFHPGISLPRAVIEGCGVDSAGNFSMGFATDYGEDDQNPFLDIDCQEVVASFDPNDKRGFPLGVGEDGEITFDDDLEYMIRFQNTGTAPAYKVVIFDDLPEELDLATFTPGTSSHPHTLDIFGRTLRWTFEPIILPDSGADEVGSHGFVKFRIDQAASLQYGDQIRNAARIVFDQNEAILTDTSLHTLVPDLTFALEVSVEPRAPEAPGLTVWPNPARESAQFLLEDGPYRELNLEVYTLDGRLLRREARRNTSTLKLDRNGLAPGMYLFRLTTEKGQTASGKLMIQ